MPKIAVLGIAIDCFYTTGMDTFSSHQNCMKFLLREIMIISQNGDLNFDKWRVLADFISSSFTLLKCVAMQYVFVLFYSRI